MTPSRIPAYPPPAGTDSPEDRAVVMLPVRLLPYLNELVDGGLHGNTVADVVVKLLEETLTNKVAEGALRARRRGKLRRD